MKRNFEFGHSGLSQAKIIKMSEKQVIGVFDGLEANEDNRSSETEFQEPKDRLPEGPDSEEGLDNKEIKYGAMAS